MREQQQLCFISRIWYILFRRRLSRKKRVSQRAGPASAAECSRAQQSAATALVKVGTAYAPVGDRKGLLAVSIIATREYICRTLLG